MQKKKKKLGLHLMLEEKMVVKDFYHLFDLFTPKVSMNAQKCNTVHSQVLQVSMSTSKLFWEVYLLL